MSDQTASYSTTTITPKTDVTPSIAPLEGMREPRYIDTRAGGDRIQNAIKKIKDAEEARAQSKPAEQGTISETSASAPPPVAAPAEEIKPNTSTASGATGKTEEPKVTLSPGLAALARKEQAMRQKELEIKARETKVLRLEELESKLKAKDYSGVKDLIDYDAFTTHLINESEKKTPEQVEIDRLKAEVEAVKTAQSEEIEKRFEAAVNERRQAVKALVASNDAYSTVKELKQEEAVVQHILETWEHDNQELSVEQAAKEVEEVLLERAREVLSLSKLKPKEVLAPEVKELPPLKTAQATAAKTLTNNMAATGEIKRSPKPLHGMTDAERYAEARRRAEEKLKLREGRPHE